MACEGCGHNRGDDEGLICGVLLALPALLPTGLQAAVRDWLGQQLRSPRTGYPQRPRGRCPAYRERAGEQ
jgi:hypothetical protein